MPPTALLDNLRTIGQRVRAYAVAIGISRIIASAVALLVAVVFIDWSAHFTGAAPGGLPGAIRLSLEIIALGLLVAAGIKWIVQPASRKISLGDVAGRIEERYPQFGDTLRSTVNFLSGEIPGSESMKKLVIGQATERMSQSDMSAVVNTRPVIQSAAIATGSVLSLIILAILVGPAFRHIAFSWLTHPLSGEIWPKTVQIAVDGGMPTRIAAGEPVPVKVRLTRGDSASRHVLVRYRYDDGRWQEQVMDRGPDGAYAASLDSRLEEGRKTGGMQIEVVAGDDEAVLAPVTIVPRLDLAGIEAAVTAPAYVRASNQSKINLTERPAVMAYGSTVDLALHFNKPLSKDAPVQIQPTNPGMTLLGVTWDRPSPETAVAHFPADQSFRFTVHATDEDNFKNLGAAEFELIVREDTPPTVQIEEPRRSEDRTADAEFPLKAVAEDDYGILHAQLIVQRVAIGATTKPAIGAKVPDTQPSSENKWTIDLVHDNAPTMGAGWRETGGSADRKRYELTYDWDLAKLENANLKPGDVLEYFVQVKDNFSLNGREHDWVPSGKLRISIISQEQFTAAVQAALENIHGQLGELLRGQVRNKTETDALRQLTARKQQFNQADRVQADRIAGEQSNTASQTMQIAGRLADMARKIQENKATDPSLSKTALYARQQLQNTAEGSMKEAARSLSNARDQKGPDASRDGQQQRGQQDVASPQDSKNNNQTGSQSDQQVGQNGRDQNGQNPNGDQKNPDAKNGDQKSSDQQAAGEKSGDQKPGDAKNADAKAGDPKSGDPKSGDSKSGDSKSSDAQNGDAKAGDAKAGDPKNADSKNADQNGDAKAGDQKPGDAKPGDPKDGNQSGQKSDANKSDANKSGANKSGQSGKNQSGKNQSGKNQNGQPQSGQPQAGQPQDGQPQSGQPQSGQPQSGQPQSGQPQSGQPQSGQPQSGKPQSGQQSKADQKAQPDQKPLSKEALARDTSMDRASDNEQKAADEIRKTMDSIGNFDGLSEYRTKLQEIRDKQIALQQKYNKAAKGQLGKKPQDIAKDKQDELSKLAEEQKKLSEQTRSTLDAMQKKADQMSKSDQNSAQAMKQAAQTGNDQQVPGKQDQASQSMQQNQQGQAEQQQQMAQIGLQMVIAKLTEAERRKLEELQAKLADAKALVEELVRRQAGHNLDNLQLQGGDVFKKLEVADRDDLIDNSQRDPKALQEARNTRDLNMSQRVTERNARDVVKKAEELPDPAPAAKITVAAGDMERAIVSLNNEKLAEAYEPPQFEALAALVQARDMIDKALAKTQEQLNEEKRDTIRVQFQKLLVDQKKVGEDIVSIDGASKKGALPRPTAIRLGQLPGDQGGIADRADKLGGQLAELDSIVYVWANADMVKTMRQVKDDLAKPDTTIITQADETRIEDQLQAMIDSLKVKPKQSKFNERQQQADSKGGQQSGKPKVKMPSEAELQLLKALQLAVNKNTTTIAKAPEKDKNRIAGLGGRQGDLRGLLDKMIQKATEGATKLGPEPDNRDQLPEEAKKGAVEDQELDNQLLNDKLTDDQSANSIKLTGDRMARSRQRLALNNDPGKVTQEIQKRIVIDIDGLIQQAQNQQAQQKPGKPQPGKGQQPRPGQQQGQQQVAQGQQQQGKTAAQESTLKQGDARIVDTSQKLNAEATEWGKLHPRDRQAIVEAQNETVNPKYQKLVDDYYKSLNDKAVEQNR